MTTSPTAKPTAYAAPAAARELGVHLSTIRRLIAAGDLAAFRVGRAVRIPAEEIDRIRNTPAITGPPSDICA